MSLPACFFEVLQTVEWQKPNHFPVGVCPFLRDRLSSFSVIPSFFKFLLSWEHDGGGLASRLFPPLGSSRDDEKQLLS